MNEDPLRSSSYQAACCVSRGKPVAYAGIYSSGSYLIIGYEAGVLGSVTNVIQTPSETPPAPVP